MPKTKTQIITEKEYDMEPAVKIAVMNNDIKHVNDTLTRIENKFDTAIQGFVTGEKLSDVLASADAKHADQDKAIKALEDWNKWALRIVLGTILTGVITFCVYMILARMK